MLKRVMTVVAGTTVFVTAIGLSASASEIVTKTVANAVNTAQDTVGGITVQTPGTLDKAVGGVGGGVMPGPVRGTSPVVGYISITANETAGIAPTFNVHGALADPTQWACAGAGSATSYSVKCVPTVAVLPVAYKCDVLHADVHTSSATASARTTLDCDSDGVGEAGTSTVSGVGGWDSKWSVDGRSVTAFTCTIDNARGDWGGGCGDPGVPTVTVG